jgi:hypothetical protein
MHKKMQMLQFLLLSLRKDVVVDKAPKQPMTHTSTHAQTKQIINHQTSDDK